MSRGEGVFGWRGGWLPLGRLGLIGLLLLAAAAAAWAQAPTPTPTRHALVVAVGQVGGRTVLESAPRDAQAMAAALRAGGFEVQQLQDPDSAALRAALQALRTRLKSDSVGVIYYAGLAAQVDGRNLLLPTEVALNDQQTGPALAALLRAVGLPLQELLDALAGGPDATRMLVVDGAWRHPTLARLVPPGLARPRAGGNTAVLFGHALGVLQDLPTGVGPAPDSKDPRDIAATPLAKVLVELIATPRLQVAEVLRTARLATADATRNRAQPWVGGETSTRQHLADAQRLERPATAATPSAPAASASAGPTAAAAPAPAASAAAPPRPALPIDGRTSQAPGQGERPVFNARSNSFGHAEGDTLSYHVLDTRKDEVLASYTLSIDAVRDNGALQANGGRWQLDAEGRAVVVSAEDGTTSRFEPAEQWWWARPRAGEGRAVAFRETVVRSDGTRWVTEWSGTAQVGSLRLLETPGGEFDVLPIKTTGQGRRTEGSAAPVTIGFTRTVWYAPKLGLPVAVDIEDNDAEGRPLRRERIELTHAQQLRGAN